VTLGLVGNLSINALSLLFDQLETHNFNGKVNTSLPCTFLVKTISTPAIFTLDNVTASLSANVSVDLLCPATNKSSNYIKIFTLLGQ